MTEQRFTIKEVCRQLNVPRHTVSHFCERGFIPHVRRNRKGFRVLEPWQIDLLNILIKMKQAGFDAKQLRQYSRLYRQGEATARERLAILITRKHQLQNEIKERQAAIDFIEREEELANQTKGEL